VKPDEDRSFGRAPVMLGADVWQIIDSVPAFVWCASPDGSIEFLNQRGLAYTGFSLGQIRGWQWKDTNILHPDDMQRLFEEWSAIVASGQEGEIQARMKRFDGEYKWFLFRVAPLKDHSGRLAGWLGVDVEIDERKRAQDQLQQSQSYLAEAQKLSRTGSFGWKTQSGELIWSAETFCILEYEGTIAPTLDLVLARVHPEDRTIIRTAIEHAKDDPTGMDFEHRLLMPNGKVKHVHVVAHPSRDPAGALEFVGAVSDVTVTKLAQETIRHNTNELRRIVDLIPQILIVLDPKGYPLYANQVALSYFGVAPDELPFIGFGGRVSHPEDVEKYQAIRRASLARGAPFQLEQRALGKNGGYRWFLFLYSPLENEQRKVVRWYVTGTDIEERKQAEQKTQDENLALREEIGRNALFEEIVGTSPALRVILSLMAKVAPTDSTVLITGETGTGKELVARAIHKSSHRAARPFVSVNCAALAPSLISSELFGHEKGAFTGATQRRLGRFELARGGTIFLDEVGELPADTQIALLRVLQEREFERVGGGKPISVDVRVIAATNRDLGVATADGTFRGDLFYRLNVFPIEVPPLRERKEDISMLLKYFLERYARKAGKRFQEIDQPTLDLCRAYGWPGNIRELQNVVERSVILSSGGIFSIQASWLPTESSPKRLAELGVGPLKDGLPDERQIIEAALRESRGRVSGEGGAAARLRVPPSTLESRIKALKISKSQFKFG
jgi:PAS domain S-box-containing protein